MIVRIIFGFFSEKKKVKTWKPCAIAFLDLFVWAWLVLDLVSRAIV